MARGGALTRQLLWRSVQTYADVTGRYTVHIQTKSACGAWITASLKVPSRVSSCVVAPTHPLLWVTAGWSVAADKKENLRSLSGSW